ncbi:hypothetical protein QWI17_20055 [Gilvimarinus sp. SDUM040013]|uniref:Uncharacterized protein n=1 Tax=Gilvimarinus gilvus TaxID=3058038 RepID=A0ABU4RZE2_9GAMM|nr:hypothetical protein [Gilvimarinus sp. SDUM040013]MDO3388150.1 hypothetical protein [Gilvimarinus sp. SDUM040013]MDX6850275.1 hypothetical protein [Gilvimarinus sp. SDUM040013]
MDISTHPSGKGKSSDSDESEFSLSKPYEMPPMYQAYLDGRLGLEFGVTYKSGKFKVHNAFPIDIIVKGISEGPLKTWRRESERSVLVEAGSSATIDAKIYQPNQPLVITERPCGGFLGIVMTPDEFGDDTFDLYIDTGLMVQSHAIGNPPAPSGSALIPQSSQAVLISAGAAGNNQYVLRHQYWALSPNSFTLLPNQRVSQSSQIRTGVSRESSTVEHFSSVLNASTEANWGAFSASVSGQLSYSRTRQQSVSITETKSIIKTIEHDAGNDVPSSAVLLWQLRDRVTIVKRVHKVYETMASVENTETPILPKFMLYDISDGMQGIAKEYSFDTYVIKSGRGNEQ